MNDVQVAQLFTNMSTHTAQIVASNTALAGVVWKSIAMASGFILAGIVAVTWKG